MNGLLVRLGGLGDLLIAVPALQFLRRRFPDARFTLVSREDYGGFLCRLGVVDQVERWDSRRLSPLFSHSLTGESDAADWIRAFDLIVVWQRGRESGPLVDNLIALAGAARCRIFRQRPGCGESISLSFFRQTVQAFQPEEGRADGLSLEDCALLPVGQIQRSKGLSLIPGLAPGEPFVVVHTGSGGKAKIWPLNRYLEIIRRLGMRAMAGVVVTGEAEFAMDSLLQAARWPPKWTWVKHPPLDALAGLLSLCRLYLGNDSGVTHLAAACGAEVIALFLEANAEDWRPLGRVRLLAAPSLEAVALEDVWEAVGETLGLSG